MNPCTNAAASGHAATRSAVSMRMTAAAPLPGANATR